MSEKKTRRRVKQTISLGDRLTEEAQRLRMEAQAKPPGIQQERLMRRARQLDTAANVNEWINSPGLVPPT